MLGTILNTSNLCQEEILELLNSTETWYLGMKMWDSWGKPISGYLNGRIISLGDYDECVGIDRETPTGLIRGKYCYIPSWPISPTLSGQGICIPHNCELPNIEGVQAYCQTKNSTRVLDEYDYFALYRNQLDLFMKRLYNIYIFRSCFLVMFFVLLTSTFYDEWNRRFNTDGIAIFRIFSVTSNWKKLFSTKIGQDQVSCLAGFRTMTMAWIVAAHEYTWMSRLPLWNPTSALQFYFDDDNFYITGAFTGVDTFIFIGGFVVCYQCVINIDKERLKFKTIPFFYMHRLLRLVPPLATLFLIHVSLQRRINTGPIYFPLTELSRQRCLNNWIPYFFFYQNYANVPFQEKCLLITWYLNMDMQLYILSPLVLIPLTRCLMKKKMNQIIWLFVICTVIALIVPVIVGFYSKHNYYQSHIRIISYLIGIMSGYMIAQMRHSRKTFPWWINLIAWTLCISIMSFCVYKIGQLEKITEELDMRTEAFYNIFGRTFWCCSLTWIIFYCTNNKNGILNRFLSNPFFLVVGKLSFASYLIHPSVIIATIGSTRTPIWFSFLPLFMRTISDLFVTGLLAIVWVLCLESPAIAFSKILYESNVNRKKLSKYDVTRL